MRCASARLTAARPRASPEPARRREIASSRFALLAMTLLRHCERSEAISGGPGLLAEIASSPAAPRNDAVGRDYFVALRAPRNDAPSRPVALHQAPRHQAPAVHQHEEDQLERQRH